MHVIHLTRDLMFSSSIQSSAKTAGAAYRSANVWSSDLIRASKSESKESTEPILVVIDLECPNLDLVGIKEDISEWDHVSTVAYAPHMQVGKFEAAKQAKLDNVVTRRQINDWVKRLLDACSTND